MSESTEDFATVLARARKRAAQSRGNKLVAPFEPAPESEPPPLDPEQGALIERFLAKAKAMPKDAPPAEPKRTPTATEVRLGWYIPPRHKADTFETFRPQTPSQKDALDAAREWVESVKRGDGGALALIGGVGTGKSHLLYAACRAVNEAGLHCAGAGWYDLADVFRQSKYGHEEDVTEARVKKGRILGASALCIDEIRPTSGTEYDTTELSQLMTRAYREKQGIFVTSNYADEKLAKIVGLAASSRLTQIAVVGPDMRQPENRHLRAIR